MSNVKAVYIDFDNLTDTEQLDILMSIFHCAHDKLPHDKNVKLMMIKKEDKNDLC